MEHAAQQAVVQIFVQTAMFDWLEPYKPPRQLETCGTAFFIDSDCHLLTSFHVIGEAVAIQIQVPSLGKERFDLEVVGVYPDRDIALLRLTTAAKEKFLKFMAEIPYIPIGDSDHVTRGQNILALGYPLGQETLKMTQGMVSGYQEMDAEVFLQVTAPLNPGNSGGPCVSVEGAVVGINTAIVPEAQNIGYVIPINDVKAVVKALHTVKIVRRPILGCTFNYGSSDMLTYFGNPEPGGIYINHIYKHSSFDAAGIQEGDMIYKINDYDLDMFGETHVSWSDDKIHFTGLLSRFDIGQEVEMTYYRRGEKHTARFCFSMPDPLPIRQMFPDFEKIDYEILGGMVVMPLTLNHINLLEDRGLDMGAYRLRAGQYEGRIIISNIFQNSPVQDSRVLEIGDIVVEVNGIKTHSLEEFRAACQKDLQFLRLKAENGRFCVLSLPHILDAEARLAEAYHYQSTGLCGLLQRQSSGL